MNRNVARLKGGRGGDEQAQEGNGEEGTHEGWVEGNEDLVDGLKGSAR